MADESRREDAERAMRAINRAWLNGAVDEIAPRVHPAIVMALPGFGGSVAGREAFLAGFRDFVENCRIEEFRELDLNVDAVGDTAVATFRYEMVYERGGERYRAAGRDLWVFQLNEGGQNGRWLAVWRAMLEMQEEPA